MPENDVASNHEVQADQMILTAFYLAIAQATVESTSIDQYTQSPK